MPDENDVLELFRNPQLAARATAKESKTGVESEEDFCPAYGFLRGIHDRALMLECRRRNGDTESFAYSHLSTVRYNPSLGLLLKFTGDVVTLVLLRGSNLDVVVKERGVNLTDRGINRHRVTWVREMDDDEVKRTPKGQPFIDSLLIAECESDDAIREWLKVHARGFVRPA